MKKFFNYTLLITLCSLLFLGCGENSQATSVGEEKILNTIKISVRDKKFSARLEENTSARAFSEMLPLEIEMNELNGNEKYFYLDKDLPSNAERVGKIHAGDLMLFGSNCVVIFYKDFSTSYSYTRLGKIKNPEGLLDAVGNGNISVKFEK